MNNPFSRLKHYLKGDNNQQENHATECLAACLVFSARIRKTFIEFLFGDNRSVAASDVEVITQQLTDDGKFIDLVLRLGTDLVVAVEVKVKAGENDHHRRQLKSYKKWVHAEAKENGFLFTLVRHEDTNFTPEQHGADGRRTWQALFKCFGTILKESDVTDVEVSLIKNFSEYLESEGIVSTYETNDLLGYGPGVKARKALTGVFSQVSSRLEAEEFSTVSIEDRKDFWPQLQIQHPRWKQIFGRGENRKVVLWYCVPGIWGVEKHYFLPEIDLWHINHGNDWKFAKSKLPEWLDQLAKAGFHWSVYQKSWNRSRENLSASEIEVEPKRIAASQDGDSIDFEKQVFQNEDDLVNELVARIKRYAAIVDSLR